jgi:hypothetical protein
VLVELLLGARVFAFLEQVFGLVALALRVGERERVRRKTRMQDPQQPDQALTPITGALAVDVFGLALAPSFLRAICSIPSLGISKFAGNVWFPDTNKNANKTDSCSELLVVFSMRREIFPEKSGIKPMV